ncbi:hypothetical protein Leryth_011427 [Lithospermum erythrorhizon]|nr:hypothetical protein Leryth_011427 [Lithospermum erythrorhizon]
MGKKRKSLATSLDEVDRGMYTTFCSAANSLSQLYTHSMNQQKLSFQAGERHALEKLYQFILLQQEEGSRVATADILNYVQTELDYQGEEPSMSPRPPIQNQNPQQMHFMNQGFLATSGSSGVLSAGHMLRSDPSEQQPRNHVFSNALSSPVRQSLQNYHISQGGYLSNNVQPSNAIRNNDVNFMSNQNRDSNSVNSTNDSTMDMHSDSPNRESTY